MVMVRARCRRGPVVVEVMRDAGGTVEGWRPSAIGRPGPVKKGWAGPRDRPASRYLLSRIPALRCRCGRREVAATEDRAMTELVAQDACAEAATRSAWWPTMS